MIKYRYVTIVRIIFNDILFLVYFITHYYYIKKSRRVRDSDSSLLSLYSILCNCAYAICKIHVICFDITAYCYFWF